ncbi:hypothetical protein LV779_15940 [Streptomyces thinghirensis]|nr:hypothetical protein [Streptomyces thinghirensis]
MTADARLVEQYVGASVVPNLESTADLGTGPSVEALLSDDTRARQLTEAPTGTTGN